MQILLPRTQEIYICVQRNVHGFKSQRRWMSLLNINTFAQLFCKQQPAACVMRRRGKEREREQQTFQYLRSRHVHKWVETEGRTARYSCVRAALVAGKVLWSHIAERPCLLVLCAPIHGTPWCLVIAWIYGAPSKWWVMQAISCTIYVLAGFL